MTDRLLLFDFDGVIADSLVQFYDSFAGACKHCNLEITYEKRVFLDLFDTNLWQGMTNTGLSGVELERFMNCLRGELDRVMESVKPFAGMVDAIGLLGGTHPLYVVTSSVSDVVQRFISGHRIEGVRGVLGAEKVTSKVEKILAVSKQYQGAEIYYVGDTAGDMVEAKEGGATAVAVGWGWHGEKRLGDAGADHVVHTPEQLINLLSLDGKLVCE